MKQDSRPLGAATLALLLGACGNLDNGSNEVTSDTATPAVSNEEAEVATEAIATSEDTLKVVVEARFLPNGKVSRPANWRDWVFVGSPVTPNGLNGGQAPFPEFHNVYVEPSAFEHFEDTGEWAEGSQIAKELVLVRQNNNDENGSTAEVSGVGYQQGEFQGLELAVKDSRRYQNMAGGWAYFSFGHQAQPYAESAEAFPQEACNSCHESNAETDFVFTQFYPVLRSVQK